MSCSQQLMSSGLPLNQMECGIFRTYVLPLVLRAYRSPSGFSVPGISSPFPLCPALPDSLDGRDSVEYYGSAAPLLALAISPPTLKQGALEVPALLA